MTLCSIKSRGREVGLLRDYRALKEGKRGGTVSRNASSVPVKNPPFVRRKRWTCYTGTLSEEKVPCLANREGISEAIDLNALKGGGKTAPCLNTSRASREKNRPVLNTGRGVISFFVEIPRKGRSHLTKPAFKSQAESGK